MRRRLVALLSLVGLANSTAPAVTQVLKGSSQPPDTKTESKVKVDKSQQENAATKNDSTVKLTKNAGEQKAGQDVVSEKVGADHITHKHIAGVKYEMQTTETGKTKIQPDYTRHKKSKANADAASKDAAKLSKTTTENAAIQDSQIKKVKTVNGESNAVKNDADRKHRKVSQEQPDALTVKQKVVENSVGAGKTQATVKLRKTQADGASKDAAKTNTGQQNVEKPTDKATPK